MSLHELIVPLGIATYSCLLLTIISGFLIFKFRVRWIKLKLHIWLGILTIILGTLHAGIVLFYH